MILLAFETATPSGGVALLSGTRLLGELRLTHATAHSSECLAGAEMLLRQSKLAWKDVQGVAASHGPGSFTGVRLGLTIAKALSLSLGVRAESVGTTEALAWHSDSGEPCEYIAPILDARVGEVYGEVFRRDGGRLVQVVPPFCCAPQEVAGRLPGRAVFSGEGAIKYHDAHFREHGVLARPDRILASPLSVAYLAARKMAEMPARPAEQLVALYLREAVEKK